MEFAAVEVNDVKGTGDAILPSALEDSAASNQAISGASQINMLEEDFIGKYIPSLKEDPRWADVIPLQQDDGAHSIAKINYTEEFRETYDYLRAVLQSDERSDRAFELTEKAAKLNPANYTVWYYRRKLLQDLQKDLNSELFFLDEIIEAHPKNYQVWFHRQKVIELKNDSSGELKFVESMLEEDAKNYHAWQYRQWLLKTFSLWQRELQYVDYLINDDLRNNSAWNQRYFVISQTTDFTEEILQREIVYTLGKIELDIYNESPWNYLRGITQNLPEISSYQLLEPHSCDILTFLRKMLQVRPPKSPLSPYLCLFIMDCFEEHLGDESHSVKARKSLLNDELLPMLKRLETVDDLVRKNYWRFLKLKFTKQFPDLV